jgi:hypothetical protein
MSRPVTTLAATAVTAASLALGAAAVPAHAEAVVYETRNVKATLPDGGVEWAALDVPTGYERDRRNRHAVSFVEQNGAGRVITVNLRPKRDTLPELKQEREALMERYPGSYREFAFRVNGTDAEVRATWVYTFRAEGTEDTEPYVSVYLMRHNRLRIVGKVSERKQVDFIKDHVVRSVVFPS